ncbi:GNAT family N-acetyltransferase [Cellulosilyticum sp. I15G10I2]|uniref:GNAT family N-acetyltransferase n=1 Tax=Cellulosilyticum sp. I15G10I2 TaxID=1892843 RepID=UPI00085C4CD1|nr:GNAT family N-acetyltransferase [Cellulosilyticum sp. I15G10I2]
MKIRKATLDDFEIIAEYNYRLAKETEDKELDRECLIGGVKALLEDESKGVYHVCEVEGTVVGQIMYTYEWSDWRNGFFLWIQSVYVDANYRKQGVFKALYDYIKKMCDTNEQVIGLRLYVEKENQIAQKTYQNLGMDECGYLMYEYEKRKSK